MINQQLTNFIRQQLNAGSTKEKITKDLLSGDWSDQDIKEGFEAIVDIPVPSAPKSELVADQSLSKVPTSAIKQASVSNEIGDKISVSIPTPTLTIDSNTALAGTPKTSLNKVDSIIALNQKLNPSLHFSPISEVDVDTGQDSSLINNDTQTKTKIKFSFSKKYLFIILILLLLILGVVYIFYFKENLKDLPVFSYFL
ncbi:MAG: hypothetical protein UR25_C0006G0004 [Candidatus Nomurabacteria bacterium GW2011_GWE1_32_28]|uniref:Uncharacterized protein n=1 Tax=Candidatus Nomurabacteria bacterium GW2011_GWF1_31_48 TaxID=1618767 RepID=A0A0G0BFK3_9BACT|nr:MAG: hypothetical protein UR10_C0006G0007 [Candidatus Nomurabacteria bacterium GW2011_GWF2_30_133]KKP28205.1 MAG: hypothetical protein UR18_C0008G0004 [Candidatus Nomurabacteria bacterium GW2011_GWE2_31_40]KKP29857.1 MAG: hypothetical protein UR19_C0007G0031 [Candidatus Nomurabacteria bacterium GW2011_GWF1_31_48]KKP34506.1 MAG: hypothetical protein UR25_C0006G0004 [Candidatus Nomurabacteria bacterium GW2011_GWE1_32_28]HAS80418.1 hypothetical protein [Candidatus Nomurabacteria bacterium]